MSSLPRLIVILGPTASGKSELGIALAEKLGGEILVCDSTQVYRHFDIGTAKVPPAEQRGIPHHLVDLIEPTGGFYRGRLRPARNVRAGRLAQPQSLADPDRRHRPLSSRPRRRTGRCAHSLRRAARSSSPRAPSCGGAGSLCTGCLRGSIPKSARPHRSPRHTENNSGPRDSPAGRKACDEIHRAGAPVLRATR